MKTNTLSKDDVVHIAKLAKLRLSADNLNKFQTQMASIIDFVSDLNQVNTDSVVPTSQVTGLKNVFRDDVIKESLSQDEALSNAPEKLNGYFKVKKVF